MMAGLATVSISTEPDVVVAVITGEIDLSNADVIKREIVGSVPNSARGVVLDMSGTSYMDSSGVHLLLDLSTRARSRGQSLFVVAPEGSRVRRVVTVAGAADAIALSSSADFARRNVMVSDGMRADGSNTEGSTGP